ncbi:MAG: hypothetical protein FWF33_08000, partial [Clostridiales bacterium]|nr:hypothetical protein [Clostridiales bacterium]
MNIFNIDLNADALSVKNLIEFAETKAVTGNILKEYIVSILLKDDNVLARVCEKTEAIGDSLRFMALEDVHALWGEFSRGVLADYVPSVKRNLFFREYQCSLAFIVATKTPEEMTAALIAHYSVFGSGKEAGYIAFKWQHGLQG